MTMEERFVPTIVEAQLNATRFIPLEVTFDVYVSQISKCLAVSVIYHAHIASSLGIICTG